METVRKAPMDPFSFVESALKTRRDTGQLRSLREGTLLDGGRILLDGKEYINVSGNDYLGLSQDPELLARGMAFSRQYGAGATASRLVCGSLPCMAAVEKKIAARKGFPGVLLVASGYQANLTLIPAIANRNTLLFSDRLNHNSLVQGGILSRAETIRFRHNDLDHLAQLLATRKDPSQRVVIVTESVFSMDGDIPDLAGLRDLASAHNAILVVDEAHATGVFGETGMGLVKPGMADIVVGTFGKGAGSFGAYIACSETMREYLVNCMGGVVFSTALPPFVIGMMDAGLDRMAVMQAERAHLQNMGKRLRDGLAESGYDTCGSQSQIVPVLVGEEEKALGLSRHLEEAGFLAVAIRPPTVPKGMSRIRISLSSLHDARVVDGLIDAVTSF